MDFPLLLFICSFIFLESLNPFPQPIEQALPASTSSITPILNAVKQRQRRACGDALVYKRRRSEPSRAPGCPVPPRPDRSRPGGSPGMVGAHGALLAPGGAQFSSARLSGARPERARGSQRTRPGRRLRCAMHGPGQLRTERQLNIRQPGRLLAARSARARSSGQRLNAARNAQLCGRSASQPSGALRTPTGPTCGSPGGALEGVGPGGLWRSLPTVPRRVPVPHRPVHFTDTPHKSKYFIAARQAHQRPERGAGIGTRTRESRIPASRPDTARSPRGSTAGKAESRGRHFAAPLSARPQSQRRPQSRPRCARRRPPRKRSVRS